MLMSWPVAGWSWGINRKVISFNFKRADCGVVFVGTGPLLRDFESGPISLEIKVALPFPEKLTHVLDCGLSASLQAGNGV